MNTFVPFCLVSSPLHIYTRSVYQAHRRGRAAFIFKREIASARMNQWLLDVYANRTHLAQQGRSVPVQTMAVVNAAPAEMEGLR
jgi:hypothetical protein